MDVLSTRLCVRMCVTNGVYRKSVRTSTALPRYAKIGRWWRSYAQADPLRDLTTPSVRTCIVLKNLRVCVSETYRCTHGRRRMLGRLGSGGEKVSSKLFASTPLTSSLQGCTTSNELLSRLLCFSAAVHTTDIFGLILANLT